MNVISLPATRRGASHRRRAPQIIEAAARVFAERGFHGATTQDIADVLGIRQASLYYYFSSKEAALELVCLKGVEGFFEAAKGHRRAAGKRAGTPVFIDQFAPHPAHRPRRFRQGLPQRAPASAHRKPPAHRPLVARP